MKKINRAFVFLLISLFALSCSGIKSKQKTHTDDEVSVNKSVQPNFIANILVSGMVCEVNCVSSVNKALMQLEGVSSVEIDFDSERDTNMVSVKFDNAIVTGDKMKETIESLNDKQYKVENYQEKVLDNNKTEVKQEKEIHATKGGKINKEEEPYSLSDNFSMPNIFEVIISYL